MICEPLHPMQLQSELPTCQSYRETKVRSSAPAAHCTAGKPAGGL
jgi:hypothetical protein